MRLYAAAEEEALQARSLLKDWAGEGLIAAGQYRTLEQETVSDLRTTNIFLRVVLFLFTLIVVAAVIGLVFLVFLAKPSQAATGILLVIFAAACYAAAESAVFHKRLYRYGIEEALTVAALWLLCWGTEAAFFSTYHHSPQPHTAECLPFAVGSLFALWLWHRFGLWYFFLAAMGFIVFVPDHWTASFAAQHVIVAALYAIGILLLTATAARDRFDTWKKTNSLAEAFLWLGVYLELNLKLSALELPWHFRPVRVLAGAQLSRPFYWATWVLIWCLPPLVLTLGIRRKHRFVIAAGAITAILTFISNKPYLGWQRHTWDPMLLGILLTALAIYLRRWLTAAPSGIRHGFTAASTSARDKRWLDSSHSVLGLVSPHSPAPAPQTTAPDVQFGGGASGGAGATGDF